MKKLLLTSAFIIGLAAISSAQTTQTTQPTQKQETKKETKTKPTSTVPQKAHNMIRPKHKKYSGHKTKTKTKKS
jgi:hypothetical protein